MKDVEATRNDERGRAAIEQVIPFEGNKSAISFGKDNASKKQES